VNCFFQNITVDDFKAYFKRDLPFQPEDADVDENNYIQDYDISKAYQEAKINFNINLFQDKDVAKTVFLYLAAHYLVIDLNNASNPLALGVMGFTQSKSVGSVSESFGIPAWIQNSRTLGMYAQTGYGRKYLSLITPYLTGNIILTPGLTTYG
jgi:hypothetical protein